MGWDLLVLFCGVVVGMNGLVERKEGGEREGGGGRGGVGVGVCRQGEIWWMYVCMYVGMLGCVVNRDEGGWSEGSIVEMRCKKKTYRWLGLFFLSFFRSF